jgi:hypothetical protein
MLARLSPHAQRAVRGSPDEIPVGRQERQVVPDAELREKGIDSASLHTGATATIAQFRGIDVILLVGGEERQRLEPVDDVFARTGPGKPLSAIPATATLW